MREEVKGIFSSSMIPKYLNHTLITVIPKCKNLESFNHYQPISLCNTVYKVISKIVVGRLRPLLPGLVSPYQIAFVPGWKGIDNSIFSARDYPLYVKKKGRNGCMAIKIDLEKVYDRLEWIFIRDSLSLSIPKPPN